MCGIHLCVSATDVLNPASVHSLWSLTRLQLSLLLEHLILSVNFLWKYLDDLSWLPFLVKCVSNIQSEWETWELRNIRRWFEWITRCGVWHIVTYLVFHRIQILWDTEFWNLIICFYRHQSERKLNRNALYNFHEFSFATFFDTISTPQAVAVLMYHIMLKLSSANQQKIVFL